MRCIHDPKVETLPVMYSNRVLSLLRSNEILEQLMCKFKAGHLQGEWAMRCLQGPQVVGGLQHKIEETLFTCYSYSNPAISKRSNQ